MACPIEAAVGDSFRSERSSFSSVGVVSREVELFGGLPLPLLTGGAEADPPPDFDWIAASAKSSEDLEAEMVEEPL